MPTMTDALIPSSAAAFLPAGGRAANIVRGGQLGVGPHLRYLDAATPGVMPRAIVLVVSAPTAFANIPGADSYLKALLERHTRTWDGIDFGYTLETEDKPVGNDGQMLRMPTNARRSQPSPSATIPELAGAMPVYSFMHWWQTSVIKNPDTQASNFTSLVTDAQTPDPYLMSTFTADLLVIQPDVTMHPENVQRASFLSYVYPHDIGPIGYRSEIGQSQVPDRQIQFHAIAQDNENTTAVGKIVMEMLQLHRTDYRVANPITQSVHSRLANEGLRREMQQEIERFAPVRPAAAA